MESCPDCSSQFLHVEGCLLCPGCGYSLCGGGITNDVKQEEDENEREQRKLLQGTSMKHSHINV